MIRAIIVDDEPPAREYLRLLLERIGGVEILGEASEAGECMKLMTARRPDVVFLDIRLPGLNGLDLAEVIRTMESAPKVVFVTGYDEYAVQAFDLEAEDYLMKPFTEERLKKAVQRLQTSSGMKTANEPNSIASDKLPIKQEDGWKLLDIPDIFYIKTEGRKVRIHVESDSYLTQYTIGELESRLPGFFRANEGCLVHMAHIREIVSYGSRSYELLLNDGAETYIPLSRSKARKLKEMLNLA